LCARAVRLGQVARERLEQMQARFEAIGDVRGLGAMLAIEFVEDRRTRRPIAPERAVALVQDLAHNGVLSIRCGLYSNGLRFLFPLVMSEAQLHEGLDVVEEVIARAFMQS